MYVLKGRRPCSHRILTLNIYHLTAFTANVNRKKQRHYLIYYLAGYTDLNFTPQDPH